jgi:Predicted 3'-5' exonuclease related to the exonuclease domain of PolB
MMKQEGATMTTYSDHNEGANMLEDILQEERAEKANTEKLLVLDIETYKDELPEEYFNWKTTDLVSKRLKDPEKIKEDIRKKESTLALDAKTGRIIHIGMLYSNAELNLDHLDIKPSLVVIEGNVFEYVFLTAELLTEREIIEKFLFIFTELMDSGARLLTFGGKRFDLPFIRERAILNGISYPGILGMNHFSNKYDNRIHCDLENIVSQGGLSEWIYLMKKTGSPKNDGDRIAEYYEKGMTRKIENKNFDDLVKTYQLYKKANTWI